MGRLAQLEDRVENIVVGCTLEYEFLESEIWMAVVNFRERNRFYWNFTPTIELRLQNQLMRSYCAGLERFASRLRSKDVPKSVFALFE